MKCSKCGKEIANDSVFCEYCGAKQSTSIHRKTMWIAITALLGLCMLLGIILVYNWANHTHMAIETSDSLEEVTDTIINNEIKDINNKKLAEMKSSAQQEEDSHKREEKNNITDDKNQKKVFVFHQDGEYRVMFKEAGDVKENDLKDLVQYAIKSGRKIIVEGYQDCRTGSAAVNQSLSLKRAENAAKLLNNMGVDVSQIEVVAKGNFDAYLDGTLNFCVVSLLKRKVEDDIDTIECVIESLNN